MKPRDLPRGVRPMGRSSGCIVPAKSFIRCKLWGTAALLSTNTSTEDRRRGHDHQRRRVDRRPMNRKAIGKATPPIAETMELAALDEMRFARGGYILCCPHR